MEIIFEAGAVEARRAKAGVESGVSAAGALGRGVATVQLVFAETVAGGAVALRQVRSRLEILMEGATGQRFEFLEAVRNVRVLLGRLRRHVVEFLDVAVADAESDDADALLAQPLDARPRIASVGTAVGNQEDGLDRLWTGFRECIRWPAAPVPAADTCAFAAGLRRRTAD